MQLKLLEMSPNNWVEMNINQKIGIKDLRSLKWLGAVKVMCLNRMNMIEADFRSKTVRR